MREGNVYRGACWFGFKSFSNAFMSLCEGVFFDHLHTRVKVETFTAVLVIYEGGKRLS